VASSYDALFCDAWGVIHNGSELFPGVSEALTRFRETRGPVIIITNAPRLSDAIPPQLDRLGLPASAYDAVVTSGDATRQAVAAMGERKGYRLGPDKDDNLFDATGARFVPMEDADFILCTGLFDDLNETPEDYRESLTHAASRKLPMICANPDRVVKFGDRLMYCAGALADLYEELGGETLFCGKPHPPIYAACRDALARAGLDSPRVLTIGDGLQTDILGANNEGLDVAFVAEGIFAEEARGPSGRIESHKLGALLDHHGVTATYALDELKW
ncbi:MAG: TIGR01459 family HAD-type hydrolase, partial [Pseudomonadota bacterium]